MQMKSRAIRNNGIYHRAKLTTAKKANFSKQSKHRTSVRRTASVQPRIPFAPKPSFSITGGDANLPCPLPTPFLSAFKRGNQITLPPPSSDYR